MTTFFLKKSLIKNGQIFIGLKNRFNGYDQKIKTNTFKIHFPVGASRHFCGHMESNTQPLDRELIPLTPSNFAQPPTPNSFSLAAKNLFAALPQPLCSVHNQRYKQSSAASALSASEAELAMAALASLRTTRPQDNEIIWSRSSKRARSPMCLIITRILMIWYKDRRTNTNGREFIVL